MDKAKVKLIFDVCEAALKPFAEKNKLSITIGNASFNDSSAKFKLEVAELGVDGETPARRNFDLYCSLYGLKPEDFESWFTYAGKQYKLVEICPNRPKFPLVGQDIQTGKRFKFGTEIAKIIRS
jgi:hypothetical protein